MRLRVLELPAEHGFVFVLDACDTEKGVTADLAQRYGDQLRGQAGAAGALVFYGRVDLDSDLYLPTPDRAEGARS